MAGITSESIQASSMPKAQPSRKGKKAWRKNIDISKVEGGIHEGREEERIL